MRAKLKFNSNQICLKKKLSLGLRLYILNILVNVHQFYVSQCCFFGPVTLVFIIYGLCFTIWEGLHSTRKYHNQQLTTQVQQWNILSLVYLLWKAKYVGELLSFHWFYRLIHGMKTEIKPLDTSCFLFIFFRFSLAKHEDKINFLEKGKSGFLRLCQSYLSMRLI